MFFFAYLFEALRSDHRAINPHFFPNLKYQQCKFKKYNIIAVFALSYCKCKAILLQSRIAQWWNACPLLGIMWWR